MSERIKAKFKSLKQQKRAGLVTFTMAYDPDRETSLSILNKLPSAGADIIELGMPFSDPMADGPAIEAAGFRALKSGAKLAGILQIVKEFRENDDTTPLILMGYYNPIQHYGIDKFIADTKAVGVDGFIVVDLPSEEDELLFEACNKAELSLIKLITPTTSDERIPQLVNRASGFIYYVSVAGITGTKSASTDSIKSALDRIRTHTDLPIAVGFGIKDKEGVGQIGQIADAVVVGSALVNVIESTKGDKTAASAGFVSEIANLG